MIDHLHVAVIGDNFVKTELFGDALNRHVGPLVGDLTIACLHVPWPDVPLVADAEVKEYLGDPAEVGRLVKGAHALVTHVGPVTRSVIDAGDQLRIVGCCRGGPVNVNVEAATQRGIPVVNAPGRNSQAVVEFTIGLILAECRGIARAHAALSQGIWLGDLYRYDRTGRELRGQTIGLVGLGAVAQLLVPYLKPFGLRVIAFDPFVTPTRFAELGVEPFSFEELLHQSDIVSLHARVTPQTTGMMGNAEFAAMKPGAFFINTARGPLVDYNALYEALASGHLAGAGIDCFPEEPPPSNWPLLSLPNVTLTPHIAGSSQGSAQRGAEDIVLDIANWVAGRPLERCVNCAKLA
jgi:D-3-phosphoglycerate dehydrogenase / 2-oxoglutarate reductase